MSEKPDEDSELFENAMQDVKRIKPHNLAERNPSHTPARERIPDRRDETDEAESGFVRPGMQKTVLRRLRSEQIPIEDELDLHGFTAQEAEHQVKMFLRHAQAAGRQRAVRVIHGRGLGSREQKPVLKSKVAEWLLQSEAVLAFCAAGPAGGGAGAVHILLKRR